MQTELPETVTEKVYIYAKKDLWDDKYKIHLMIGDITDLLEGYILLGTKDITVSIPRVDLINGALSYLNKKKDELLASNELAVGDIDKEIKSLLQGVQANNEARK